MDKLLDKSFTPPLRMVRTTRFWRVIGKLRVFSLRDQQRPIIFRILSRNSKVPGYNFLKLPIFTFLGNSSNMSWMGKPYSNRGEEK
jgi:hypothetical protein